jgi:hypothetical protein
VRSNRAGKAKTSIMQRAFGLLLIVIGLLLLMTALGLLR